MRSRLGRSEAAYPAEMCSASHVSPSQQDRRPEERGRGDGSDKRHPRPESVGLELVAGAGVEHEMAQA